MCVWGVMYYLYDGLSVRCKRATGSLILNTTILIASNNGRSGACMPTYGTLHLISTDVDAEGVN